MKKLLFTIIALFAFALFALAEEKPYAALSDNNTVLTFYYDDQMETRNGMSVGPFNYNASEIGWFNQRKAITTVVFDVSFANCTSLTSTALWFPEFINLTTVTGIENLKTDNVTDMHSMFSDNSSLMSLDLSSLKTDNVTNMSFMFAGCSSLTRLDLSGLKTDNVRNMFRMFWDCSSLTNLDLSGFKTDNVTNMSDMFYGCSSLTSLDLSGFMTGNVTDMGEMFYNCFSLTSLDLSGFKNDDVMNMSYMFYGCSSLTSLDLSGFKTDNVKHMSDMFSGCSSLTNLDLSGFKTDNVTDMSEMFYYCSSLTSLDVRGLKADNVTNMSSMFSGCSSLTSLDLSGFTTNNVTNMSKMFYNCSCLTNLEVSGIKTDKVIDMSSMFSGCSGLTSLDLSNFKTDNVAGMSSMFEGCSNLTTIYVSKGWSTKAVNVGRNMFEGCTQLVGGKGTTYDSGHINYTYANIDEGTSNPGYFAEMLIMIHNTTREYGEGNPTFDYTTNVTDLEGTPSISCEATATSPVGEYPIIVSKGSITKTGITYVNGTLTVTKAPLKVSVKSRSRRVGEMNPTFELTYTGFKNGETEAVLTKKPTVACAATTDSPIGIYPIIISGGIATNYELIYENGTLSVIFEIIDNNKYHINGQTAEVTKGNDEQEIIVPEKMAYNGTSYPVTSLADGAFAHLQNLKNVKVPASVKAAGNGLFTDCPHLAAIIWEAPMKMTQEMAGDISNPNLLFYTSDTSYAPSNIKNVINSQTNRAERIVLTDEGENHEFYCPEEFTADEIVYTHTYNQLTEKGACRGWETLALPFDVTDIIHEDKGVITPFGALDVGYEYVKNTKPFWLYQYSSQGFKEADRIRANVPYIISMPNEEARLGIEYILKGNVTLKGTNATVKATSTAKAVKSGNCSFTPNFGNTEMPTAYLLNVGENYDIHPEGSIFVKGLRNARPFEAYFELEGSADVKPYFGIFEHLTDEIRSIEPPTRKGDVEYYQLDGTKRTTPQRGFNVFRTLDGKMQKMLVK